jgi:hypothetical protein
MGRGGARPGAGRKRKSLALHRLTGTFRADRHEHPRGTAAAVLPMPAPAAATDWRPDPSDVGALSPRAQDWLHTILGLYVLNALEGRQVLEALRVLSRCELLEAEPGMGTAAALVRERKLFQSMWVNLRLEK